MSPVLWIFVGLMLAIALILAPMAFHSDPPPRRPSISRPAPRPAPTPAWPMALGAHLQEPHAS